MATILLVEDNPDDEALTLRALRRSNRPYEVTVARDGAEALDHLFDSAKSFQLVVLDLKLPKVDGVEVLRRIRSDDRTRVLPVIVLTSSDEQRDVSEVYKLGVNNYVRKSMDASRLLDVVQEIDSARV